MPQQSNKTHGILLSVCGIAILALNVIEAADRGATIWNVVTIAIGAFLLFYGFTVVARPPTA